MVPTATASWPFVQVAEALDLGLRECLLGFLFKAPDLNHLAVERDLLTGLQNRGRREVEFDFEALTAGSAAGISRNYARVRRTNQDGLHGKMQEMLSACLLVSSSKLPTTMSWRQKLLLNLHFGLPEGRLRTAIPSDGSPDLGSIRTKMAMYLINNKSDHGKDIICATAFLPHGSW